MHIEDMAEILFADEELPTEKKSFQVTDYKSADWCLVQAKRVADHMAKVDALYGEYKNKLDAWREKAQLEANRTIESMEYFLRPFVERELAGKKKRSFELPTGKVGFRKLPNKVEWDPEQEETIIDWAEKELPDAVKMKKSLLKTELKKAIDSGMEIPLVNYEDGQDKFYIDVT